MSAEASEAISIFDPGECAWDVLAQSASTVPEPAAFDVTAARSVGGAPVAAAARPVVRASPPRSRFDLAARPRVTRAAQIARTLDEAFDDERFRDAVGQADAARDRGDWVTAQHEYGQALHLFPLHWGYCIQYAHAIKEQGLYPKAEVWYRSAVALGAPGEMVDEHLVFVAQRNGVAFVRQGTIDLDVPPLLAPPTIHDIRVLGRLARVPGLAGEELGLTLLREARDNRAVLMRMIAMPEFARSNRAFLDILRG
jgi:tetratricopeptide (TPR) repeat protein